jgi:enoyl-CoA hydratase/carnithine racemase
VAALTFSLGSVAPLLPSAEAPQDVIAFLQGTALLAGAGLSLLLSKRIATQPWSALRPQAACIALFTAELWHLIV